MNLSLFLTLVISGWIALYGVTCVLSGRTTEALLCGVIALLLFLRLLNV
jgi:hypothetical protein